MKPNHFVSQRQKDLVMQEVDGDLLIYDLFANRAFCLNETSAMVWKACSDGNSVPELVNLINLKNGSIVNDEVVWFALEQLAKEGLVEIDNPEANPLKSLPRREAIKRVGLASMAAIPIVMALNAPVAAASASVCGDNLAMDCRCTTTFADCGGFMDAGNISTNQTSCGGGNLIDCTSMGNAGCSCNGPFVCGVLPLVRVGMCT